jgi:hypothetical protein
MDLSGVNFFVMLMTIIMIGPLFGVLGLLIGLGKAVGAGASSAGMIAVLRDIYTAETTKTTTDKR